MRYFLDTEFNGFEGDLISIALVPLDRREPSFYRVIEMTKPLDPWVAKHVAPKLWQHLPPGFSAPEPRFMAGRDLAAFLREPNVTQPSIVADWPTDFTHLLELLITGPGYMESVPDFRMEFVRLAGFNTADHSKIPHNALSDAEALRDECVRRFGW